MTSSGWFEQLTGFREESYESTQRRLLVEGDELVSAVNGKRYDIGRLTLPTLAELRTRVNAGQGQRSSVQVLQGDVRALHSDPAYAGALFQVASQFNLLEMTSPEVSPEHGVARYAHDHTQGPACATAAGAATIYRNYCVPVGGGIGQTRDRQLNALAGLGSALSELLHQPVDELWHMSNGYALCTRRGLTTIGYLLDEAPQDLLDELRGHLAIGLHSDVEVTDPPVDDRPVVSQAYCSALPVSYSSLHEDDWKPFAKLVLEAAYEATLLSAAEKAGSGGSNTVLLTRLGGGAFGNHDDWINDAIVRGLRVVEYAGLDIRIVSYGSASPGVQEIVDNWG